MIGGPKVVVNIGAVKPLPRLEEGLEEVEQRIGELKEKLETGPDKVLGAELQRCRKRLADLEAEIEAIETSLSGDLDKLRARQVQVQNALGLHTPAELPAGPRAELEKLLKIQVVRLRDVTRLTKIQKKCKLKTEPAKLDLLATDLEEDVGAYNRFEASLEKALEEHHAALWEKNVDGPLDALLKKEKVSEASIGLDRLLKAEFLKLKKAGWRGFDAAVPTVVATATALVLAQANRNSIRALGNDFLMLNAKKRFSILEKGEKADTPAAQVRQELLDTLADQRKPSKSQWVKLFGMAGYQVSSGKGRFDGYPIHLTFDKNSWSVASDGGLDVSTLSVQEILDGLFGTVGWANQVHATLEVTLPSGKYPHVYWGGHVNRWDEVERTLGKDAAWSTRAQAALTAVLDEERAELRKKIKIAKDNDGNIPG